MSSNGRTFFTLGLVFAVYGATSERATFLALGIAFLAIGIFGRRRRKGL